MNVFGSDDRRYLLGPPHTEVKSKRTGQQRVTRVTTTVPIDFEVMFGVSPADLRAQGIDPAEFARQHGNGNGNDAYEKVATEIRRRNRKGLWAEKSQRPLFVLISLVVFGILIAEINPFASAGRFESGRNLLLVGGILGAVQFVAIALVDRYGTGPSGTSNDGRIIATRQMRWFCLALMAVGIAMMIAG